jgi:monoterpene epsilon-lactone hydrolase
MLSFPMASPPEAIDRIIDRIKATYAGWRRDTPAQTMRKDWDALFWSDAMPVCTEDVDAFGVPCRWVIDERADPGRVLVYFHGGGYKMGSCDSHHDLMARLSVLAGCRVLGVNYRLLPEHRFPAPVEDACTAYRWVLSQGLLSRQVAFGGDSAGGGLVAAALLALKAHGDPLPAAALMFSALTDFETQGRSYTTRAESDPIHNRALIQALGLQYLGPEADPRHPLASPLHGDLHGLPPLLLQVGDRETGLDDSVMFAERARAAGVPVTLEVWDGMIHVFQQFAAELPEAQQALARAADFLKSSWSKS